MRLRVLILLLIFSGCSLEEHPDFMIGRGCSSNADCDPGQRCLPHAYVGDAPSELRCRDRASFAPASSGQEAPLAYCEAGRFDCPEGMVCKADRVRQLDGGIRREVCHPPESPFGPPP
jgi:hypothetical protein